MSCLFGRFPSVLFYLMLLNELSETDLCARDHGVRSGAQPRGRRTSECSNFSSKNKIVLPGVFYYYNNNVITFENNKKIVILKTPVVVCI